MNSRGVCSRVLREMAVSRQSASRADAATMLSAGTTVPNRRFAVPASPRRATKLAMPAVDADAEPVIPVPKSQEWYDPHQRRVRQRRLAPTGRVAAVSSRRLPAGRKPSMDGRSSLTLEERVWHSERMFKQLPADLQGYNILSLPQHYRRRLGITDEQLAAERRRRADVALKREMELEAVDEAKLKAFNLDAELQMPPSRLSGGEGGAAAAAAAMGDGDGDAAAANGDGGASLPKLKTLAGGNVHKYLEHWRESDSEYIHPKPSALKREMPVSDRPWLGQLGLRSVVLPPALRDAIQRLLKPLPLKQLRDDVRRLQLFFQTRKCYDEALAPEVEMVEEEHRSEQRPVHFSFSDPAYQPGNLIRYRRREAEASAGAMLTFWYASAHRVLSEIFEREPEWTPQTILDYGSGLGTVPWVVDELWGVENVRDVLTVDTSADMLDVAAQLRQDGQGRPFFQPKGTLSARRFLPMGASEQRRFDLVVGAYVLGDLASAQLRRTTLLSLWERTGNFLVLVEPNTKEGFKNILQARHILTRDANRLDGGAAPADDDDEDRTPWDDEWMDVEEFNEIMVRSRLEQVKMDAEFVKFRESDQTHTERVLEWEAYLDKSRRASEAARDRAAAERDAAKHAAGQGGGHGRGRGRGDGAADEARGEDGEEDWLVPAAERCHVYAPCPHEGPCPMAHMNMPCFTRQKVSKAAGQVVSNVRRWRGYMMEDFCYLILQRGGPADAAARNDAQGGWDRLVGDPIRRRNHTHIDVCSRAGPLRRYTFGKRATPIMLKRLKRMRWGDMFLDEEHSLREAFNALPQDVRQKLQSGGGADDATADGGAAPPGVSQLEHGPSGPQRVVKSAAAAAAAPTALWAKRKALREKMLAAAAAAPGAVKSARRWGGGAARPWRPPAPVPDMLASREWVYTPGKQESEASVFARNRAIREQAEKEELKRFNYKADLLGIRRDIYRERASDKQEAKPRRAAKQGARANAAEGAGSESSGE